MKYDVDYFIKKFEAIPDEIWGTGEYFDGPKCCALGHCGIRETQEFAQRPQEGVALQNLFGHIGLSVIGVNDNVEDRYKQSTPKQRILTALRDIKNIQEPVNQEPKTVTKYVAVPVSLNEETKKLILS